MVTLRNPRKHGDTPASYQARSPLSERLRAALLGLSSSSRQGTTPPKSHLCSFLQPFLLPGGSKVQVLSELLASSRHLTAFSKAERRGWQLRLCRCRAPSLPATHRQPSKVLGAWSSTGENDHQATWEWRQERHSALLSHRHVLSPLLFILFRMRSQGSALPFGIVLMALLLICAYSPKLCKCR